MRWRRHLRLYLLAVLAVGSLSLYLSYGPFTSDAWFWAFGAQPEDWRNRGGGWEWTRLVLLCLLFYFVATRQLAAFTRCVWGRSVLPRPLFRWRRSWFGGLALSLWILVLVGVPLLHAWVLPAALNQDFSGQVIASPEWPAAEMRSFTGFERAYRPYLLYMPYTFSTYGALAIPAMLMIVASIRNDRRRLRRLLRGIDSPPGANVLEHAVRLRIRVDRVYSSLQTVMDRYSWVLFLLAFYYAIEISTLMFGTLSCIAQVVTSWSAWLFALVVVPYFFVRTYRRFRDGTNGLKRAVAVLRGRADGPPPDGRLLDEVQKIDRRIEPDSMVGYLKLISRTRTAYLLGILLAVGLVGVVMERATEKDPRHLINRVLPMPVDAMAIRAFDLVATARPVGPQSVFEYQECFENYAPVSEVVARFRR